MTTPDGVFSPQLWVQRVMEGAAEQELISRAASCASSPAAGNPAFPPYGPASMGSVLQTGGSHFESPASVHSNHFGSPSNYSYTYSSSYTPPKIASPIPDGSWGSPRLPPAGHKCVQFWLPDCPSRVLMLLTL